MFFGDSTGSFSDHERRSSMESRKRVSQLVDDLRELNKRGVDMYKNHSSNKFNWKELGKEKYGKYFNSRLECIRKGRALA